MSDPQPVDSDDRQEELERAFAVIRRSALREPVAALIFDRVLADVIEPHHRTIFWGDRLLTLDKSVSFRDEPQFEAVMREVNSSTGANQYASPDKISWRLHTLIWAGSYALKIPGDFVECGVFKGDMSWALTEMVDIEQAGKRLFAYDTFEGFNPANASPDEFPEAPQLVDILNKDYREPGIYESVVSRFATKQYVKVIKGVVPDIFKAEVPSAIAFLHLDMNSAPAESAALEVLFDRLSDNAIIVFDDYGWVLHRRQKEAADGFLNERGYSILELPTGQGLAVISKAGRANHAGGHSSPAPSGATDIAGGASMPSALQALATSIPRNVRGDLNARIGAASQDIRSSVGRAIADSEDSIRTATNRAVSQSEERIRRLIEGDLRQMRGAAISRRFVMTAVGISGLATAIITSVILLLARLFGY